MQEVDTLLNNHTTDQQVSVIKEEVGQKLRNVTQLLEKAGDLKNQLLETIDPQ